MCQRYPSPTVTCGNNVWCASPQCLRVYVITLPSCPPYHTDDEMQMVLEKVEGSWDQSA